MKQPTKALDPWEDAQHIAQVLRKGGAELLVAIGAEAWCEKCVELRPLVEALHQQHAQPNGVCLWLDLEDHAEFIGDFVPEDLPLLLRWRGGQLIQASVLEGVNPAAQPNERLRAVPIPKDAPNVWDALLRPGWAQG